MRAPRARAASKLLEHDHHGALAEDEARALRVERPRRALRLVLVVLRERAEQPEADHVEPRRQRVRAAGEHDLRVAFLDAPKGLADGVRGRRAGRADARASALRSRARRRSSQRVTFWSRSSTHRRRLPIELVAVGVAHQCRHVDQLLQARAARRCRPSRGRARAARTSPSRRARRRAPPARRRTPKPPARERCLPTRPLGAVEALDHRRRCAPGTSRASKVVIGPTPLRPASERLPGAVGVVADRRDRAEPGDGDPPGHQRLRPGQHLLQTLGVVEVGAASSASISAHMMSFASSTGTPSTVARPETTATSSLIESTVPSSSITSPGRHRPEEVDRADREQRRALAPVGRDHHEPRARLAERLEDERRRHLDAAAPSSSQNSSLSEVTFRPRTDRPGSHSTTRSIRWKRMVRLRSGGDGDRLCYGQAGGV